MTTNWKSKTHKTFAFKPISTMKKQLIYLATILITSVIYAQTGTLAIGYGLSMGSGETYLGNYNVHIGGWAGQYASSSSNYNTFLGYEAGRNTSSGDNNVFSGFRAGRSTTTGYENAFFGATAGYSNSIGYRNTAIGFKAGYSNLSGDRNVFIGYHAGYSETGNDKLYIDNSTTTAPLIWGDFAANKLKFNGNVEITDNLTIDYAKVSGTANRAGLLEVTKSGGQTFSGISVEHSSTSAWSFMGNQIDAGLYDDYNNEWAILYNENSSVDLYYNGSKKFNTNSSGVAVTGTITTTSHGNASNWNTAHSWGNHAIAGYSKINTSASFTALSSSGWVYANSGIKVDGNTVIDDNAGWHRSYGSTGWYNGTHGGGIYMNDGSWVKVYGGKSFLHSTGIMRTDGTFQVGNGGSRFTVNGNNVGIGDASPNYPLHVTRTYNANWQGRFTNGSSNVYLAHQGGSGIHINTGATNSTSGYGLEVRNASQTHLYVRNDGYVGIGTGNAPAKKFHVVGDSYLQGKVHIGSTDTYFYRENTNRIATQDEFYVMDQSPNTYLYSPHTYLGSPSGDNIHLRGNSFDWTSGIINAAGSVGIGTTTPDQELSVIGQIRAANEAGETNYTEIGHDATNAYVNSVGTGELEFRHDGNTKASIHENGNFEILNGKLIMGTAPNPSSTLDQLLVRDDVSGEIKYRSASAIEHPWAVDLVDGLWCAAYDTTILIDVFDLHGNLSLGPDATIDDDMPPGVAGDDWIKLGGRIELSSANATEGVVIHGANTTGLEYVNIGQDGNLSVFSNSAGYGQYFMRANVRDVEFGGNVAFNHNATFANLVTGQLNSVDNFDVQLNSDGAGSTSNTFQVVQNDNTGGSTALLALDNTNLTLSGGVIASGNITTTTNITTTNHHSASEWALAYDNVTNPGDGLSWSGSNINVDPTIAGSGLNWSGASIDVNPSIAGSGLGWSGSSIDIAPTIAGLGLVWNAGTGILSVDSDVVNNWQKSVGDDLSYTAGHVGIGTSAKVDYALVVEGEVLSDRVKVLLDLTAVPDYVFAKDYKLLSLEELEAYVTKEKHLPNVPSAAEIAKEGMDVGQMNMLLLEKVEELTLHLIEQNKSLKSKEEAMKIKNSEISELSKRLERIEAFMAQSNK